MKILMPLSKQYQVESKYSYLEDRPVPGGGTYSLCLESLLQRFPGEILV